LIQRGVWLLSFQTPVGLICLNVQTTKESFLIRKKHFRYSERRSDKIWRVTQMRPDILPQFIGWWFRQLQS
jgi:hypothetical protein